MDSVDTFFLNPSNLPFIVSGCTLAAILILEIFGLFIGMSTMLQSHIMGHIDANGNGIPDHLEAQGFSLFSWLNPGRVPFMVMMVIFSTVFTVVGFGTQWMFLGATSHYAPMILSVPIVLAITLPITRSGTNAIAKIIPRDETNAITLESLTGDQGWVIIGPISSKVSGSVRITDKYGTDHYLTAFSEGDAILECRDTVILVGPHPTLNYAYVVRKI